MEALPAAIGILRAAYPRQEFPEATARLYARALADIPEKPLLDAIDRLVKTSQWLPTIAEIRKRVTVAALTLPPAGEAWEIIQSRALLSDVLGGPALRLVVAAMDACGGRYSIRMSENPTTMRAQFTRDYEQRVDAYVAETAAGHAALPPGHLALDGPAMELGSTMAELPVSTSIRPRS